MTDLTLETAKNIALTADVSSPENGAVLYSVSFLPTKENKTKAYAFVKSHPDTVLLDTTPCGQALINSGLETTLDIASSALAEIWKIASKRFIEQASGNITAFVLNADKRSTFCTVELPAVLKNEKIRTINGTEKHLFAKDFIGS